MSFVFFFFFRYNDFSPRKEGEYNYMNSPYLQQEIKGSTAKHGPDGKHPVLSIEDKELITGK